MTSQPHAVVNTIARREESDGGHTYWLGDAKWPGITTVLRQLGYNGRGADFYTPDSRQKGHGVHTASRLADQLAPEAKRIEEVQEVIELHPDLNVYVQNWLQIKQEMRYKPVAWEVPVGVKNLMTAGTLDSYGFNDDGELAIVDLKSWKAGGANPPRAAELQVMFYVMGARESGLIPNKTRVRRYIIRLGGRGRVYLCEKPGDSQAVIDACHVWWDLFLHRLLPWQQEEMEVAAIGE